MAAQRGCVLSVSADRPMPTRLSGGRRPGWGEDTHRSGPWECEHLHDGPGLQGSDWAQGKDEPRLLPQSTLRPISLAAHTHTVSHLCPHPMCPAPKRHLVGCGGPGQACAKGLGPGEGKRCWCHPRDQGRKPGPGAAWRVESCSVNLLPPQPS